MIEFGFYVAMSSEDAEHATQWLDRNFAGIFSRMREHNAEFEVRLVPLLSANGAREQAHLAVVRLSDEAAVLWKMHEGPSW